MLEQKCGSLKNNSTEVTLTIKHVGDETQYKCDIKTVKSTSSTPRNRPNSDDQDDESDENALARNPQCKTVCDGLDLTPEKIYRSRQILPDASCQAACKPALREACTNLTKLNKPLQFGSGKIKITKAWPKFNKNAEGKVEYYCEYTSTTWK